MSELTEAFSELTEAKREVASADVFILYGRKIEDSLVEEITTDETLLAGGIAEAGGYRVHIPMTAVAQKPRRETVCKLNGKTLEVLNVVERNRATYELTVGMIAAEDS